MTYDPTTDPFFDPARDDDEGVLTCDHCEVIEHADDLTPDWNGETGNHLSCEEREAAGGPKPATANADVIAFGSVTHRYADGSRLHASGVIVRSDRSILRPL